MVITCYHYFQFNQPAIHHLLRGSNKQCLFMNVDSKARLLGSDLSSNSWTFDTLLTLALPSFAHL